MTRLVVLALGAALVGVACDEKKPSSDTSRSDAGTAADKNATADPKIEKALKAAAAGSAAADNGPPPTGIFAPGVADQRHARGLPTKVDLVSEGGEPRVALGPPAAAADTARSSSYGPAMLEVVLQMGRSPFAVDYGLVLGPGKKDDGGADWLVADVKRAAPSKAVGQVAPGTEKEIAGLEGTEIRIQLTPDGRESDVQTRMGKSAQADLDRLAQSAAEALVFSTVPTPPKPVGVGAQWIAETRMPLSGLDVIAYRAYRVKSIEGDRLHLTLDVKAYAASKDVQLPGLPKGATLEQFDGLSQGEMEVVRGETLARKSDVQQRVVLGLSGVQGAQPPPQQPGQPPGVLTAQIQMQGTLVRGEDLRAASRRP
jgi:hypothetical protein